MSPHNQNWFDPGPGPRSGNPTGAQNIYMLCKIYTKVFKTKCYVFKKKFYNELIDYITGKLHNENVIAIVYKGENAIQKIRDLIGETHPDKASSISL